MTTKAQKEPRPAVRDFAIFMEETLQKHDDQKGAEGWLMPGCEIIELLKHLKQEVGEVERAFNDCQPGEVEKECADVANLAMMIVDRIRHRRPLPCV